MTPDAPTEQSGVMNLFKPVGRSSARFVYRLRPILGVRKVGHAGTLDPFADGVLVACVGKGTRLVERIMNLPKRYRTTMRLGVTNETFDTERPLEPVPGARPVSAQDVASAVAGFVGSIKQIPPIYSAMRVGGVLSYELAKRGRPVELPPRPVTIYDIRINAYEWPVLDLTVECGRGTYIRAIARDLGIRLGCGAVCQTLCREAVGPFRAEDAINLDDVPNDRVPTALIPLEKAIELIG